MSNQRLILNLEDAPQFIAELIKTGVTFKARQSVGTIVIEFTGGY
jgi:hypothetical protein